MSLVSKFGLEKTKYKELEKEYEEKGVLTGYYQTAGNSKLTFLKDHQPRYVLFSIRDEQNDRDKKFVRFSESGGNSHIGIARGVKWSEN